MTADEYLDQRDSALTAAKTEESFRQLIEEAPILSKYHGQHGFYAERFIADYEQWRSKCRAVLAKV